MLDNFVEFVLHAQAKQWNHFELDALLQYPEYKDTINMKADDEQQHTPLAVAILAKNEHNESKNDSQDLKKTIEILLRHGADIDFCDDDETSLLHFAARNNDRDTCQLLLQRHCGKYNLKRVTAPTGLTKKQIASKQVHVSGELGFTPADSARIRNFSELADYLDMYAIEKEGFTNSVTFQKGTLQDFKLAARNSDFPLLHQLIQEHKFIQVIIKQQYPLLYDAMMRMGSLTNVRAQLDDILFNSIQIWKRNNALPFECTPKTLTMVVRLGLANSFRSLTKLFPKLLTIPFAAGLLHDARRNKHWLVAKLLDEFIDQKLEQHVSSLHFVRERVKLASTLLQFCHWDFAFRVMRHSTVRTKLMSQQDISLFYSLLEGFDSDGEENTKALTDIITLLETCCKMENESIAQVYDKEVHDAVIGCAVYPLHYAAAAGLEECVEFLLDHSTKCNELCPPEYGRTAADFARYD